MLRGARDQALEGLEVARRMLLFEMERPSQGSVVMVARILDLLYPDPAGQGSRPRRTVQNCTGLILSNVDDKRYCTVA